MKIQTAWEARESENDKRWHGCANKFRYPSKRVAVGAIRVTVKNSPRENDASFVAYKCRFCGGWHAGHNRFAVKAS